MRIESNSALFACLACLKGSRQERGARREGKKYRGKEGKGAFA